jgi:superfamily II DNA or RNA helicase
MAQLELEIERSDATTEPSGVLDQLPPADRMIAELKALVGDGMTKGVFFETLRKLGLPSPDGRAWSGQKVNESVDRLVRKRVMSSDLAVAEAWREPLMLRVIGRPSGATLIAAVRAAAPRSFREGGGLYYYGGSPHSDVDLARSVRLAAMSGQTAEVERLIGLAERATAEDVHDVATGAILLSGCPADLGFLDGLEAPLRDRVAAAHVEMVLNDGAVDDRRAALIQALRTRDGDWREAPRLDQALLRLDLLGERPDSARARIARLRTSAPVAALMAEAALAFLTGPAALSLPAFREALKQHRKAVGRRKVALPREFALYHLLALFAAGDVALHREIELLLEIGERGDKQVNIALKGLLELVAGRDARAQVMAEGFGRLPAYWRVGQGPVETAVTTLALGVIGGGHIADRAVADLKSIDAWGALAPLAARILSEVHGRFSKKPEAWSGILQALGPGYGRSWLEIVPIRPSWERALDKLEGFLAPPAEVKPDASAQTRRLIFLLDSDTSDIRPMEQAAKRDGWSAGRAVSLKRLHQRDPKLDYLTPEDHLVLGAIRISRDYYSETYQFDTDRGPLALIGHPRVFDADHPERRIELVAYPVELVVREEGDQIRLALSHRAEAPRVFVEVESPTRWRVVQVTQALVELAEILGPQGLVAPKTARDRVVALVKADNPRLPVRSELEGVSADVVAGEVRPILQIAPHEDGFEIRACVRPLGEDGPTYTPGLGAASVLVPAGAGHRRVNRDLAGETAALEAVAEACPALASWRESDHVWRLDELDATLEALQQLHAYEGPLVLEWPQGAAVKPTRTVDSKSMSLNVQSAKDWFEVSGKIRVDEDLVLDMAEVLARLGAARGRFVPLDDGRFLALTEDLRRRLEAFAAVTEGAKGGRRIGAAAAPAAADLIEAAGAVKADKRWTELVARIDSAERWSPEPPEGLNAELRDYQLQGFRWLARLSRLGLGACLADDMGLGKTVQTLALLLADSAKGPSLVAAPTSVCHNWALEAARFTPDLRVHVLSSVPDRAACVEALAPGDVLVVSYGLLHTEADLLAAKSFAVAVFDEAQNLKNAETHRARASKRIQADFRLALSGTPVENRLEELWSLYDTVSPGLLGSRESFQRRFAGAIEKGRSSGARQALKTLVRPYLLRRTKATVLTELPPRTEITLEIEPGPEERAFYEALRRKALDTLAANDGDGGQKRIRILAEITRLRRAACNPALIDATAGLESAKLAGLLDLVAELRANRHRVLVFSQFTGHLDLVEAALRAKGLTPLRLDGSTPAKERARRVEAFQAGEGELFLISLKAGGTGLNLTGADYVIHLDPWWNPAVEDQATDRAHRIGQTRPVTVYRLIVKDSIEEKILALHAAKRDLAADFLDGAEATAALGEDELMALIRG